MEKLFAYGTLLEEAVQMRIIGRRVTVQANVLPHYHKGAIRLGTATYPQIYRQGDSEVPGGVMSVTAEELHRIDAYEGSEYARIEVTLQDGTRAWAYVRPD